VLTTRAAQFLDGQFRVARIEQQRIDFLGSRQCFVHAEVVQYVNHLHQLDARQSRPQYPVTTGRQRINELNGAGPDPAVMLNDRFGRWFAGEEKGSDWRRHRPGNGLNGVVFDYARSAGHPANQTNGRGPGANRQASLLYAANAANLNMHRYLSFYGAKITKNNALNGGLIKVRTIQKRYLCDPLLTQVMNVNAPNDTYASLRYPEFRYFVANTFLITATLLIQEVILGYELYKMTHDPLALGFIGLAEAIPFITLSLFGGHVADRREKRTILQISLSVIVLGSVILYAVFQPAVVEHLSQTAQLSVIYGVLMLIGTAKGFYSPASSSLKPFLVPRELYANSSTWGSSFMQAGAILGPAIAGFLDATLGFDRTLLVVIGALIVCLVLISLIAKKPIPVSDQPQAGIWASLKEGIRFVFSTKIILYSISLDLFSVLFGGVIAILPVFANDILHVDVQGLGILRAAPSVGAIGMMAFLTRFPPTHNAWRNMLIAVVGFGVFTLVFAFSTHFWLSALALFMTGAFDSVSVVIRNTILQIFPPDHMRGRVAAVNGIFVSSSNEIGAFESGLAARVLGAVPSVALGGAVTLLVVGYIYTRSKELFSVRLS